VFVRSDASSPEDNEGLVRTAVETYGRLDGAVNNAGIGGPSAPTGEYPLDGWRLVMSINLDGVFYGARYQIPAMLESGGGSIVNIASILGQVTFAGAPAYVAAKHGVVGLTKQIANEYAAQGIRCTAVGPGFIDTPLLAKGGIEGDVKDMIVGLHPVGRLGRPEEIGDVVAWLVTDAPEFLNGAYIPVDGGYLTR
jgi:NAD(P)-dependent dehydrogenase (short-subunit alcohol dehydrogenase family)